MPSIDAAMAQSLRPRRTLLDVVVAAVQPVLVTRDVSDVKTAFSSWDNCMNAVYCKWPVIAVIIVGSLFLLSIVWCIARCACCGMSFCCECCSCLKCCGNCCGCCDPPRNRRNKYLDEPYLPPNQGGYRSEAPMTAGAMPPMPSAKPPPFNAPPQFASFDVSKTANHGNDDALPVMPSWETANTTKVYVEEEVEMDNLGKKQDVGQAPGQIPGQAMGQAAGHTPYMAAAAIARSTRSPSPISSPNNMASPYGPPRMPSVANRNGNHPTASNGYLATGAIPPATDAYGRSSPEAYGTTRHSDVSELSADYTQDYNYGAPAIGASRQPTLPYQNNTPQQTGYGASPPPGQQRNPGYGENHQGGGYNDYRHNGPSNGLSMSAGQPGYGVDPTSIIAELDSGDSSIPAGPAPVYGAGAPGGPGRYGNPSTGSGPYEIGTSSSGGYAPLSNGSMNARPPPQRQYTGSNTSYNNTGNTSRNQGGNASGDGYGNSYGNGYGSSYGNSNAYGNSNGSGNAYGTGAGNGNGYGNMGTATGYGASSSPTLQNSGGFNFNSGNNSPMNNGSRPMNGAASPPPLAQPQPARSYGNYGGYRGM